MKKIILLFLFLGCSFFVSNVLAGETECDSDSLKFLLKSQFKDIIGNKLISEQADCFKDNANSALDSGMLEMAYNNYESAIPFFERAIEYAEDDSLLLGDIYYLDGKANYYLNNIGKVLDDMEKAVIYSPRFINAWANLAFVLDSLEFHNEALAWCDSVLKYQGDNYQIWYIRANALIELRQFNDAIISLDSTLKYRNDQYKAWFDLGHIYFMLGDRVKAMTCFMNTLNFKHNHGDAWLNAGLLLMDNGLNPKLALRFIDSAITFGYTSFEPWLFRGMLLMELGRLDEALESYDSSLAYDSENDMAWVNRAKVFSEKGRTDSEFACYDSALANAPYSYLAWINRASALIDLGRYAEALRNCDSSIKYSPDYSPAKELKAIIIGLYGDKLK